MRTPSWDTLREFLKHDGWREDRTTGHDFFEKTLPDGEILRTHASRSGAKTMSPGRFKAILADQLKLSEAEFWEAPIADRVVPGGFTPRSTRGRPATSRVQGS